MEDIVDPTGRCAYIFRRFDSETDEPLTTDVFNELPSRAIGNAVAGADAGEADAINNFAVLFYAGIENPDRYDEESVLILLGRAAREGRATVKYNLGVLSENRGEKHLAARYYEEARALRSAYKALADAIGGIGLFVAC